MELKTKYGTVNIFTDNIDNESISQITELANSVLGENANIKIMPDVHAGKGCVIGTTMIINDKICPNLVGVDIGCGVTLVKTTEDFANKANVLDKVIREYIPSGSDCNLYEDELAIKFVDKLRCKSYLEKKIIDRAYKSLGTLGGGNHFIEAYQYGYLCVHSGSRNIGKAVAEHYQKLAIKLHEDLKEKERKQILNNSNKKMISDNLEKLKKENLKINKNLLYLENKNLDDYLHDMKIMVEYASANRKKIIDKIVKEMNVEIIGVTIDTKHNYIENFKGIEYLRKGAISAKKDELCVIPLNMRDGILVVKGKGNVDWNMSAPHGAGRLYSRSEAKKNINLEDYKESMKNVYSTSVNINTVDESPFAYKDCEEIKILINDTVKILEHFYPVYNYKDSK